MSAKKNHKKRKLFSYNNIMFLTTITTKTINIKKLKAKQGFNFSVCTLYLLRCFLHDIYKHVCDHVFLDNISIVTVFILNKIFCQKRSVFLYLEFSRPKFTGKFKKWFRIFLQNRNTTTVKTLDQCEYIKTL